MTIPRPEMTALKNMLEKVIATRVGGTLFVTGEPGIGKSTLIEEFLDHCDEIHERNVLTATGRCVDIDGISRGFLPWKEILIELDADRSAGNDAEKKRSLKSLVKALFDESSTEWMQNIPQVGEISAAIIETARAIKHTDDLDTTTGETRELSFRERLAHVVTECTGAWLGAIPFVGGLAEAVFKTSKILAAGRSDIRVKSQQDFFELVMNRLRALAMDNPIVVFLDDLQWGDASSLALLLYLAKNLQDAPYPLILIGAYRPEDVRQGRRSGVGGQTERHPLEEKINTLKRYGASTEIELDHLDRSQIETYLARRLPNHQLESRFIDELLHMTNGNILFIKEMLSNTIEQGFVAEIDGAWQVVGRIGYSRLPGTIEGVIRERYERLSDDLREILTVAAVMGREFSLEVVESVLQENQLRLHQHVDELINRHGLIHRSSKIHGRLTRIYEFTHNLVQKYVYHSIDESYRRVIHRVIAESLHSVLNAAQTHEWKGPFCFHFGVGFGIIDDDRQILVDASTVSGIEGGEETLGRFYQLEIELADEAIASYNNAESLLMCDEVLALARILGDAPMTMEFLGKKAGVLEVTGEWSEAERVLREYLSMAMEIGDKRQEARSRQRLGWLLQLKGSYDDALNELTGAVDLYEELGDRRGVAAASGSMGEVYFRRGDLDLALASHQRRASISEEMGSGRDVAHANGSMGNIYFRRGDLDRALEKYERWLRISEELGDRRACAVAIMNVGNVFLSRGEHDRALQCYQRKLDISEELGWRHGVSLAIGNMGGVFASRGEYDRAREYYERQLQISSELGDRRGVARARGNLGLVFAHLGEYDRALEQCERELQITEELGDRGGVADAHGSIGLMCSKRGEHDRAIVCYERQLQISAELGNRHGMGLAIGNMGDTYFQRGEYENALASYERAAELHRSIGFRYGLCYWLLGSARVLLEQRDSPRTLIEECLKISNEISNLETLFGGRVLLARMWIAEGDASQAEAELNRLLSSAADDAQRAEVHYWLWKLGLAQNIDHRSTSESLYANVLARTPDWEYKQRLSEVQSAARPP